MPLQYSCLRIHWTEESMGSRRVIRTLLQWLSTYTPVCLWGPKNRGMRSNPHHFNLNSYNLKEIISVLRPACNLRHTISYTLSWLCTEFCTYIHISYTFSQVQVDKLTNQFQFTFPSVGMSSSRIHTHRCCFYGGFSWQRGISTFRSFNSLVNPLIHLPSLY